MHDGLKSELWRLFSLLLIAALLGSISGSNPLVFGMVFSGYLLWHLHQIHLLERWLQGADKHPSKALGGIWATMADSVARARDRSRKRKKRLSRLLKRFHMTLEAVPDAAVVVRKGLAIEWANGMAGLLLGVSPKQYGQPLERVVPSSRLIDYLQAENYDEPLELCSPANEQIYLEVRVIPFGQGQRLLFAHDVSEARRLSAARRDFVANVSHELRTPLTVICGYLELLQNEDLPDELMPTIEASAHQANRMQRLVVDLLMLSRIEMEEGVGSKAPLDQPIEVPALLAALVEDARQISGGKQHDFELDLQPGLLLAGSETELTSAFGNLINNAVLHTPEGCHVQIGWRRTDDGAAFWVADNGPGIPAEHLPRLTERFYRVDKGRSRERGGTGLGLSIVKHVVQRHDGQLAIESVPGRGTKISVLFAAARVTDEPRRSAAAS